MPETKPAQQLANTILEVRDPGYTEVLNVNTESDFQGIPDEKYLGQ